MTLLKTVALAGTIALGAGAAQAATYAASDLGLVVDAGSNATSFNVTDAGAIESIGITLGYSVCGSSFGGGGHGACGAGSNYTFNGELTLSLTSAMGTVVDLVTAGTYSGQDGGADVVVTFDDAAATVVGGPTVTSGTFAPIGSIGSLLGETAAGLWTVTIGDTVGADPKRLNSYSIEINTAAVPLPAALPLLLLGLGGLGVASRKRRAS